MLMAEYWLGLKIEYKVNYQIYCEEEWVYCYVSASFIKGDNFYDYLSAFWTTKLFQKGWSTLKGKKLLLQEQVLLSTLKGKKCSYRSKFSCLLLKGKNAPTGASSKFSCLLLKGRNAPTGAGSLVYS